ncbi:MAG: aminopeptidase [Phycisphaerae bacterium]
MPRYGITPRLLIAIALSASGCGVDIAYLAHAGLGVLGSYSAVQPVAQVIADGGVSPEQARKLQLVQQVRSYAEERIGLNVGGSYANYEDNGDQPTGYLVGGSRKDRFEAYLWYFPIVGGIPNKIYFDRELAQDEADWLESEGYDAFIGEVIGFSTGGILADPIRTSNLRLDDFDLADFVFHELLHNTTFRFDDVDFNESAATFVGRTVALQFFRDTFGPDSPEAQTAVLRVADLQVIDAFILDMFARMNLYYAMPLSSEAKIAGREDEFTAIRQLFTDVYRPQLMDPQRFEHIGNLAGNNAVIMAGVRYQGGLQIYRDVFDAVGGDWADFLFLLREAAAAPAARTFLRSWLNANS